MGRLFRKRGRELLLDAAVATGWTAYASVYLARLARGGGLTDLGLFLFLTLLAILFLVREPTRRTGAFWESLLGLAGTFWPAAALRPAPGGLLGVGEAVQVASLGAMLAAALSLGRSFGIAPADRGLRTTWLYGWVRHPLYATELCFYVGYLIAHLSWRNALGLALGATIQIARIWREERILEGYAAYARRVRFRLIPYVW